MKAASLALVLAASVLGLSLARAEASRDRPIRDAFSPLPFPQAGDANKIALGRDLFSDRRMSRFMKLSCASCHDLSTNGATASRLDRGDAAHAMQVNTPTVFNSVFSFRLGWAGHVRSLHDLALGTLRSEHLMSGGGLAARRLAADPTMLNRFRAIYGAKPTEESLADALTAFMNTLVTPDAPFDRYLRGDKAAMTDQQIRGFARFRSLGCASCHQGLNIGANLFQRRGIFHPLGDANPPFLRVPSLRNVAVTPPYFHDGSVDDLSRAIKQMAHSQLNLEISNRDIEDISSFLNALTGKYQGHQLRPAAGARR
ncbi:cytochrome-c peroxidase [Sphingomonas sp. PAMC 26605]|uniref:cytochrome-c peroxidase n=1 Tax=Sphingomonas sp. PAMC 26605 TaxID=1112214 RepID=UPI0004976F95|nr:cytochrome c peroxidase [Sphingomonas sp. PAMC 26605]